MVSVEMSYLVNAVVIKLTKKMGVEAKHLYVVNAILEANGESLIKNEEKYLKEWTPKVRATHPEIDWDNYVRDF